jgi:multiple sugar transport system permease protein
LPSRSRVRRLLIATLIIVVAVGPVYWALTTAIKTRADAFAYPPVFIFKPTWKSYEVIFDKFNYGHALTNSLVVVIVSTVVASVVGLLAAYSLSRYRIRGGSFVMFALLSVRMFPAIALALPLYLLFSKAGLFDTRLGLIIAYTAFAIPIVVWMMRSFLDDVPTALDEAAMIDGYTRLGVLTKVVTPLAMPGLVATATFVSILLWNEFLIANVLTSSTATTIPVSIVGFNTDRGIEWNYMAAAASLAILPVVAFTILIHKKLVRGLTFGAVKG